MVYSNFRLKANALPTAFCYYAYVAITLALSMSPPYLENPHRDACKRILHQSETESNEMGSGGEALGPNVTDSLLS